MRDLLVLLVVLGSIPIIFVRPYFGVLVWAWLGYMNPHRLTWGFAYDMPFAQMIAIVTLLALFVSKERKAIPWSGTLFIWFALVVWFNLTTLFALNPDEAFGEWDRTMKIQLFTFITVLLMHGKKRIHMLVWVIAMSLAFFGVKGGLFAIRTGGNNLVWGPPGSFIEGNNAVGLALVMTMPLLWYLQLHSVRRWVRFALWGAIGLSALAVLATNSRGAFLAIFVMAAFLWLKSPKKLLTGVALVATLPLMLNMMPEDWHERMGSIPNYEEDTSAMGRINAWWFAWNLALDRPVVGGGFNSFSPELFRKWAPDPEDFHDAHSIYFEVLGEHGFVGLGLFLALGVLALMNGRRIIRLASRDPPLRWARDLAAMVQVSLIGYAVGGAFLGLAYFDLYYHLIAILLLIRSHVESELGTASTLTQASFRMPRGRSAPGTTLVAPQGQR